MRESGRSERGRRTLHTTLATLARNGGATPQSVVGDMGVVVSGGCQTSPGSEDHIAVQILLLIEAVRIKISLFFEYLLQRCQAAPRKSENAVGATAMRKMR